MKKQDSNIVAIKLSAENRLSLISGDWFEATHSFGSSGTYKGDFGITDIMILDFVKNFKAGVVRRWPDGKGGFRLKLNFDHWAGDFAGWINDVKVGEKQLSTGETVKTLMMKADVTPDAQAANKMEGYEYTSIEYFASDPMYVDDQTGQQTANVLTGGALTSDPFVMEIEPMALSTLVKKHEDAEKLTKEEGLKNQKKEELSKMKTIIATLGTVGVKLSNDASEESVNAEVIALANGKKEAETKLSTVSVELSNAKKELSEAQTELSKIKDAQAEALKKDREEKITALKTTAVSSMKLSKAELEEKDVKKQKLFVKLLSLDDLSLAEQELEDMKKKEEVTPEGIPDGTPEGLSVEDSRVKKARELMAQAKKDGKKLSNADALEQVKAFERKAAEGGK